MLTTQFSGLRRCLGTSHACRIGAGPYPLMTLLLIRLITAALAIFIWSFVQRTISRQQRVDMRLEGQVLHQDAGLKSEVLVSNALGLRGKPDLLLRQGDYLIPIDKKPGRKPSKPYLSQTMQLAAYCG